jgi:eukaryotic-like serine/threonine-protein kinase
MSSASTNFEIGATVGDYQIVSLVGRGGMGKVFKVRNLISDRVEAMKVLLPDLDPDAILVERFLREIKVVACLEHPNIASLRTALRIGNQILMIMEYVEGNSLQDLLKQGRMDVARALLFTQQILDALAYAHGRGIVHRDVKPSNILVGPEDRVKLTDFGIASRSGDPKLTAAGRALGSLHYMSPEQMKAEMLDVRSDLYSVGVTLYEMVTGETPVQGKSYFSVLRAHLEEKPTPAVELVSEIGPMLSQVIDKALEKVPEARFQTADEFRSALNNLGLRSTGEAPATAVLQSRAISGATTTHSSQIPLDKATTTKLITPSSTGSKMWDPEVLENVRKNLAVYVGPMAKVLVSRFSKKAQTLDALCHALAAEIASPSDREKFLRSQPL